MANNLIFFILWLITSKVFSEWSFSQLSLLILKKRKNGSDFFFFFIFSSICNNKICYKLNTSKKYIFKGNIYGKEQI